MIKKHTKKIISFSILAIFLLLFIILFQFINPEELVNKIGVRNGYLLAFIVSFFGGFSAGGSITFISLLITLAAGGMNPLYLGLVSGISLMTGDLIMFYIFHKGRDLFTGKIDNKINKIANIFEEEKWLKTTTPLLSYIYIGLSPFPNDILILFLATIKYPFWKTAIILILGDITFTLSITFLASRGLFI